MYYANRIRLYEILLARLDALYEAQFIAIGSNNISRRIDRLEALIERLGVNSETSI
jgi:hypothetical protein